MSLDAGGTPYGYDPSIFLSEYFSDTSDLYSSVSNNLDFISEIGTLSAQATLDAVFSSIVSVGLAGIVGELLLKKKGDSRLCRTIAKFLGADVTKFDVNKVMKKI